MSESTFEAQCREAVGELRSALLELYRAVGADPAQPQEVSRRFKLNKNLTWKAAKVFEVEDAFEAAHLLPGQSGLGMLIDSLSRTDSAPVETVERARRAGASFDRMVEIHTEDRVNLELVLDSMGGGDKPLLQSRLQAFRGNSGIWGLQCQTQVITRFIAPSITHPGFLDQTLLTGWTGIRRLRRIESWPLIQMYLGHHDGSPLARPTRREPLADSDTHSAWTLDAFCTGAESNVRARENQMGMAFELCDGPVGRQGEFTCFFGYLFPGAVPRFADAHNTHGEFRHGIAMPTKHLLLDLFVHLDLVEMLETEISAYGSLRWANQEPDPQMRIPMSERPVDVGPNPRVATPLVNRYAEMVDLAMLRGGRTLRDFRLLRLRYEYPPMHATMVIKYALPEAPR